jgi:hypothetical protein
MNGLLFGSKNRLLVAVGLCLAGGVLAQPATSTNAPATPEVQPVPVQPVPPVQPIPLPETTNETTNIYINAPELTNQLATETGVTNPPPATTTPPPLLGPRTGAGSQLMSPVMGTSVIGAPPGAAAFGAPLGAPLLKWGPVDVHASLLYSLIYGNGIEAEPGQQGKTFINTFSPGLTFDLGSHWVVIYSPSYTVYSNPDFRNTLSESALLSGNITYGDWAFRLSQSYAYSDSPLIETGTQTTQEAYSTALGATYQMSGELSLQLLANQDFRFAPQFDNIEQWTGSIWLNAQVLPQVGTGLGFTGGYDDLSVGSSMPFETVQGRITFNPGTKLSLALSGGVEDTQFVHPSAPSLLNPTFSASLFYQPLPKTTASLSASRTVTPAFYGNTIEVVTSISASLRQELSKKIFFSLSAGYMTEPLTSVEPAPLPEFFFGPPPARALTVVENNSYTTVGVSLYYAVISHGSLSIFYSASDNSSGQANFKYSSTQVGLSASYRY